MSDGRESPASRPVESSEVAPEAERAAARGFTDRQAPEAERVAPRGFADGQAPEAERVAPRGFADGQAPEAERAAARGFTDRQAPEAERVAARQGFTDRQESPVGDVGGPSMVTQETEVVAAQQVYTFRQEAAASAAVEPSEVALEAEPVAAQQVFADRVELARRYVRSLREAGTLRGLIGPRETPRLWSRHVLNSAVVAPLLPPDSSVVDVGSGAGLPGIPLAIARPDCTVILIEPLLRRTVYLAEIVAELGLTNVRVLRGRAEDLVRTVREPGHGAGPGGADVVTSRAVAPLAKLAGWSVPLLRRGGMFLPLKGASAGAEIERDLPALLALGLQDPKVIEVGAGLVDPVTVVVSARLAGRR